jgi:hypothetical protein
VIFDHWGLLLWSSDNVIVLLDQTINIWTVMLLAYVDVLLSNSVPTFTKGSWHR